MKLNRCPICHSLFDVMALAQDEATKELLVKLAKFDTLTGVAVMGYLSLFCPAKSQLTASRSLTLINEIEVLSGGDWQRLAVALEAVTQTMWSKKRNGDAVSQFKNHNYLKKVFAEAPSDESLTGPIAGSPAMHRAKSKTRGAIELLETLKHE